ncbi:MAG: SDR family NAD(P)-dependent oxidoreductase [Parabacteroides merdae]
MWQAVRQCKSPDDASVQAFREAVEQECGVRSFYRPAVMTDAEELKGFVEEVARTFGRIDMVVSNAGMNVRSREPKVARRSVGT